MPGLRRQFLHRELAVAVSIELSDHRERLAAADVPEIFQGAPIGLITAGLMSIAFLGFAGLDKGLN